MSVTLPEFEQMKLSVLRPPTRQRLSCMLNTRKVLPSPDNLPRDWTGLTSLLNFTIPLGCNPPDPMDKILDHCKETTIAVFIQCLEKIDRYDVIDDIVEFITSDIIFFKEKSLTVAHIAPVMCNYVDHNDIITIEDIDASKKHLPLPRYDAYILYDDADIEHVISMVEKLENEYPIKLCFKDRNLKVGIEFECHSVIKLISERCDWLIIILSDNFSKDPNNTFIMRYIQSSGIEKKCPKIIPCIFDDCRLPQELQYYVKLFFNDSSYNSSYYSWNRLKIKVTSNHDKAILNNMMVDNKQQPESKESKDIYTPVVPQNKPESIKGINNNNNALPKKKNVLGRLVKNVGNIVWNNDKSKNKKVKCSSS